MYGTQVRENFLVFLEEKHLLSPEQVNSLIVEIGRSPTSKIREILLKRALVSEENIYAAWAEYYGLPYIDLRATTFDPYALGLISSEIARRNMLIPFNSFQGEISVAFDNPDANIVNQLKQITRCNTLVHIATRTGILEAIEVQYGAIDLQAAAKNVNLSRYERALESREIAETKPIVDIANGIITSALQHRASDIHFEPREDYLRIRFRIDGVLHEKFRLASELIPPLTVRYKIMANLNISERRMPQDGRIQYTIGERQVEDSRNGVDIRVSVIPTIPHEKIVLRLLDKSRVNLDMGQMSFAKSIYRRLERIVSAPHGAVFVTGPTGSGKTTTLYAILNHINQMERNIVTIEDPVEYRLPLINQIQVNPAIGLDFAKVLRAVLRQDPDVILVGEIRDLETAEIATEAALTGHLVFSSLHTNNAIDAVTRLVEIGVEPFMVAPSIIGILAQRLGRRICPKCKEGYIASPEEMFYFGLSANGPPIQLYRGKGCPSCLGTGYSGRIAIHEMLTVNDEIRDLISQQAPANRIAAVAYKTGYSPMRFDGLKKALRGLTTLREVLHVTIAQEDVLRE
ncbi:Flp pilus assembly complex ATPase component TadA [Candidatus Poribacteria bacterium]|nr:Flp pilus assembly complex ATPase component TadA [Candidatus Poribacteria bacterium]